MACGAEGIIHTRAASQATDKQTPLLQFVGIPSFFGANPDAAPFLKMIFNYEETVSWILERIVAVDSTFK